MCEDLVSVVVSTYNSEHTIIETLNSVKNQTYHNIELIVTDDCSQDDTCNIVWNWINKNVKYFKNCILLKSDRNYGITRNFSCGVDKAKGKWVKIIGGDDLLLRNCVKDNLNYCNKEEYDIIQSCELLINEKSKFIGTLEIDTARMRKAASYKNSERQMREFAKEDIHLSPSLFFRKEIMKRIGGLDFRIRNIEDYPFKMRVLNVGIKIGFLDMYTVKYRIHDSISHKQNEVYSLDHLKQVKYMNQLYSYKYFKWYNISFWISDFTTRFEQYVTIKLFRNKNTLGRKTTAKIIYVFNPIKWQNRFTRVFWGKDQSKIPHYNEK